MGGPRAALRGTLTAVAALLALVTGPGCDRPTRPAAEPGAASGGASTGDAEPGAASGGASAGDAEPGAVSGGASAGDVAPPAERRFPNVVLILADDLAWTDYGFMGSEVARTPNLDALARSGTVFTHGFNTASVCRPSHRTYLSGLTSERWNQAREAVAESLGVTLPRRGGGAAQIRTLPRELRRSGYVSFEGGKMWEGTFATAGFDAGMADIAKIPPYVKGDDFGREGIDAFADFLDEVGDRPFFAWLAPKLPHEPFDAPAEKRAPFEESGLPPAAVGYYANVLWLDAVVGEILAELRAHDLLDETVVVYAADNGWNVDWQVHDRDSRRSKATLYELGYRTPFVFSRPGTIPAGATNDGLVTTEDLYATILDFAGVEKPPDRGGESFRAALESGAPLDRRHVAGTEKRGSWIRTADRRYVERSDGSRALFRIEQDPEERDDVLSEEPETARALAADLEAWRREVAEPAALLYVAGLLRSPDEVPIPGAALRLDGPGIPALVAITDANGWFEFRSLPHGSYTLAPDRGVTGLERVPRAKGRPGRGLHVRLPLATTGQFVTLEGTPDGAAIAPDATGRLSGLVRDAGTGRALAGAAVTVLPVEGESVLARSLTDGAGRYVVENVPRGTLQVRALAPGRRRISETVELGAGETTRDFALASGPAPTRVSEGAPAAAR